MPTPREGLDALPVYRAGRPAPDVPGLRPYKLSSNENPFPPLERVADAVREGMRWNRYPDPHAEPLREAVAARLGVTATQVACGTGSLDVLNKILAAYVGPRADGGTDEVVFAWRSFESYPISVRLSGARPLPVPLRADGTHDLDAMAAAVTPRTRVVILCTPNNPTGPALGAREVDEFLARVPEEVLVVVDEAYIEFVRRPDPVDALALVRGRGNVVALRTFSKAHGLADLRVGYAVSNPEVIAAVQRGAVPFAVSTLGQAAAIASLEALDAVQERVARIVAERERVVDTLRADGWSVPDAQGNFYWLGVGEDAERFGEQAAARAMAVRVFPGDGVRVSVGIPDANDRMLALCADWRHAG